MKEILLGFFVTILFLQPSTCQEIIDNGNDLLEWYYNIDKNHNLKIPREKRQSRRFNNNFDYDSNSNNDDDDWYVFDEVEQQSQPQNPQRNNNNQFWSPRQQQQPDSFGQFNPNLIPSTSPRPQIPNAGPPRPSRCVEICFARTTSEYNPVCGSNGMTYNNLAKMDCAASCGINVQFQREGRCAPLLPPPPPP